MKNNIAKWSLLGIKFLKNAWPTASEVSDVKKFKNFIDTSFSNNLILCRRSSTLKKTNVSNVIQFITFYFLLSHRMSQNRAVLQLCKSTEHCSLQFKFSLSFVSQISIKSKFLQV